MASTSDIEHLVRRTEFVARPARVQYLLGLGTIEAAVADILNVPANPGSAAFTQPENWQRGEQLTHFWLDRMAHDSPKPIQEKMGFFWHGHFCSEFGKVGSAELMREQIDTFRYGALGNLRTLALEMSTQVAMLRYLDNNQNRQSSPNQNFARELMELFLLGVGNYTEVGRRGRHRSMDGAHRSMGHRPVRLARRLARRISTKHSSAARSTMAAIPRSTVVETINVILDNGIVPSGASVVANRGRPTKEVAAEFLSYKLWTEFAGTNPPAGVIDVMREAAITGNFEIKPWLQAMLTHDAFYTTTVKRGLVRSPVEFVVAALVATGRRSSEATPLWLMQGMGQRPLFPPNVSGWKHNGYWVNASAMSKRTDTARSFAWRSMTGYWSGDGLIHLGRGTISRTELQDDYADQPVALLDRFTELMGITLSASSHQALADMSQQMSRWERSDLLSMILLAPDFHVA